MTVSFNISKQAEEALRAEWGDLAQAAKEALLMESYRAGKISIGFLAEILGMGVVQADEWLAQRGVPLNYSEKDVEEDRKVLVQLLSAPHP